MLSKLRSFQSIAKLDPALRRHFEAKSTNAFFASIKTFAVVSLLIIKGSLTHIRTLCRLSFFRKKALEAAHDF